VARRDVAYWLLKTEASAYSIHDLERDGTTLWDGVRNYWARNFMQVMKVGDKAIVYHTNAKPSGAAGVAKVTGKARPDPTAFDRRDSHFDPKSNPEKPTWFGVDVSFVEAFPGIVALADLQEERKLGGMMLLSGKSMRLSVQPITKAEFDAIVKMGRASAAR
jgi:predicted RNA-binding protein with PUA-like domain